jgi:hypothetical protein
MGRIGLLVLLCSALTAPALAAPKTPREKPQEPAQPPAQDPNQCVKVEGVAQWVGIGYTHAIQLRNGCERAVVCTVWTDVDPEPKQTLNAGPGESVEAVTRRGSPARELTAFKKCMFR